MPSTLLSPDPQVRPVTSTMQAIPTSFQPLNPSRGQEWAAFPASAQAFIWEQQRELASQEQRLVWASRHPSDRHRLARLQTAHRFVLKDLQKLWDDGNHEGHGFRRLPAEIVAKIVRAAIRKRNEWCLKERARLCCVSRLFEALALDVLENTQIYTSDHHAPNVVRTLAFSRTLCDLGVSWSPATDASMMTAALVTAIPLCTSLQTLRLTNCPSTNVGDAVALCTSLTKLCCSGNPEWLDVALPQLPNVEHLELEWATLPPTFPATLRQSSVTVLHCRSGVRAPFSWFGIAACVRTFDICDLGRIWDAPPGADPADLGSLQDLSICQFRDPLPAAMQTRLLALLPTTLRVLEIQTEWRGAADLSTALGSLTSLTRLRLPTFPAVRDLAMVLSALPRCTSLQWLVIDFMSIDDATASIAATVLPQCTALTKLELGREHVEPRLDLTPVLASLNRCSSIRVLALFQFVDFEATFLVRWCEDLVGHPSLTTLDLSRCLVSQECRSRCMAIFHAQMPHVRIEFEHEYDHDDGIIWEN